MNSFKILKARREWRKTILGLKVDLAEISTTSSTVLHTRQAKKSSASTPSLISGSNSVENSLTPSNPTRDQLARTLASYLRSGNDREIANEKNTNIQ